MSETIDGAVPDILPGLDPQPTPCEICDGTGTGPQGEPCLECLELSDRILGAAEIVPLVPAVGDESLRALMRWHAETAERWRRYAEYHRQASAWYYEYVRTGRMPGWLFPVFDTTTPPV